MGSIKKALKPITKVVDNIIPNEIKPALPYIAATFGAPYLAGSSLFGGIGNLALRKGLAGVAANVGTQALLGKRINPVSAAASGIMLGGGQALRTAFPGSELAQDIAGYISPEKAVADMTLGEALKATAAPSIAGGTEAAFEEAEKANREYDEYVRQQEAAGAADIQSRREYISRYMQMAGFDQDSISDALSRYGYKTGGRVGFSNGGSLYDKAKDMNRLAMEIKLIDLGYGGFGGKDLEGMSDEEIMKLYKEATSKADGGRIGYRIGGGPVKSFIAKLLNVEPSEEVLDRMFEERKKEIFNSMFDPEAGTGAYSMEQMQKADEMATKQAMQELEEYKMRIGMDMKNPPEGTVGSDVIEQIMGPRKEGRVKEAKGGRIKYAEGGYSPTDYYDSLMYRFYLDDIENEVISPDMSYEDWAQMRSEENAERKAEMAKGGRAGYAEGGSSTEQQKRENYFDLKRDEFMSLSEYLLSPMSDADLRSGKADGGIMNLKMGGMPAEMDLRGGGFVPIGAKEKADDVPARLSKNEFVMTADAVRAAGGGSVNKGAKRMYDLMHKLEARV